MLAVRGLKVDYLNRGERTKAVRDFDLELSPGEIVGIAGESGSGKSTIALASIGLLPHGTEVTGSIRCSGQEIVGAPGNELRSIRGRLISVVFQETITALNPVIRVGPQLVRAVRAHRRVSKKDAYQEAEQALESVRLSDLRRVMRSYPDELSGGMCQRVLIAMALVCGARALIADEPTTALDVSVQAEVLTLLRDIVAERQIGLVVISHDIGVLNELCQRLLVMYRGEVVEEGPTKALLARPDHPYTDGLIRCLPRLRTRVRELPEIAAERPGSEASGGGCLFRSRCQRTVASCIEHPQLVATDWSSGVVRCWNPMVGENDS